MYVVPLNPPRTEKTSLNLNSTCAVMGEREALKPAGTMRKRPHVQTVTLHSNLAILMKTVVFLGMLCQPDEDNSVPRDVILNLSSGLGAPPPFTYPARRRWRSVQAFWQRALQNQNAPHPYDVSQSAVSCANLKKLSVRDNRGQFGSEESPRKHLRAQFWPFLERHNLCVCSTLGVVGRRKRTGQGMVGNSKCKTNPQAHTHPLTQKYSHTSIHGHTLLRL